ncbi:MAG: hypothetical protein IIT81_00730, partial [Mycoplasmataceae bacterium]|nr:hypothetical protein [Mycoplasmataceae bacterium]
MYIFYSVCLLFLPILNRSIQIFNNKKEYSLNYLIYSLIPFTLILSPLLSINALNYLDTNAISWTIFSIEMLIFLSLCSISSINFYKKSSKKEYLKNLKYLFLSSIIPFLFTFIFFLSLLFIQIQFNDQIVYSQVGAYFHHNIKSFDGYHDLLIYYKNTASYFVNSVLSINSIIGMYDLLWTLIPIILVIYGTNDFLLNYAKNQEYKKYYLYTSIILLAIFLLGYGFFWAYGSGNVLLQASIIFLLIYFIKQKTNIKSFFVVSAFLIYFSPTGILLTIGLLITSLLFTLMFHNIKSLFYWLSYFIYGLGAILSIWLNHELYIYLLFDCLSLIWFLFVFIYFNHYKYQWLNLNFKKVYDNYNNNVHEVKFKELTWLFKKQNFYYILISIMTFCTIMTFVLYFTFLQSVNIFVGLNVIAFVINVILTIALSYKLIKKNEFNQTLFLLYFLMIAELITAVVLNYKFVNNQSIWRISYLCIGFETPVYYLAIFAITYYVNFINKIKWEKVNKLLHINNKKVIFNSLIHGYYDAKYIAFNSCLILISCIYVGLTVPSYPLSISSNIQQNKTFFNNIQTKQLNVIKQMININTNIVSDEPIFTYLTTSKNADIYFCFNLNKNELSLNLKNWGTNNFYNPIDPWKLTMFGSFKQSIYQYVINYYSPNKNVNINEQLNKIYMNINTNSAVKNFMQNTFYKNYENNFKKIIEIANSSKKTEIDYFIFNPNSNVFKAYENDGI